MFKQSITNINLSWNRETFKLLLIIFIIWSLTNYLYFYKNNNVNNINITNSTTQPDIGEPISIIQSQSPSQLSSQSQSKDVSIILAFINNLLGTCYQRMYIWKACTTDYGDAIPV